MDEKGLYEIYTVWHVPFWQTNWFYWTAIISISLACALIVLLAYRWYAGRTKKARSPWQKALEAIADLQAQAYTDQQSGKQCYFALTRVLKKYLEERFGYPVGHTTDEETARYLEKIDMDKQLRKDIQNVLRGSLLIKFANQNAVNAQIQEHLALAKQIVESTIPQEKEAH